MGGLLIAVPAGPTISTPFYATEKTLRKPPDGYRVAVGEGPYVAMNMRNIVAEALRDPTWSRLLVFETDMLPEPDMLIRHAAHTAPVVGSVYFQHYPPYDLVCTLPGPGDGLHRRLSPTEIRDQVAWAEPHLMAVKSVGLGCTSVAREVFERWPKDWPTFRNEWTDKPHIQANAAGEVSHDAWWCERLEELGIPIVLDTGIRLDHLSHVGIGLRHHAQHHGYSPAPPVEADLVEEIALGA